ncbi:unnamed protein product, partial [Pleuronectes platessa]
MSLRCAREPCFYGSVSEQASQQEAVVQMSRGQIPHSQSHTLSSPGAETPKSHFNFCSREAWLRANML